MTSRGVVSLRVTVWISGPSHKILLPLISQCGGTKLEGKNQPQSTKRLMTKAQRGQSKRGRVGTARQEEQTEEKEGAGGVLKEKGNGNKV